MLKGIQLDLGLLVLRLTSGGFMLAHGWPKFMKFFAEGPIKFADPIGIGMTASLVLAVFGELICSILIMIGFKTRLAAIPAAITMFVAAFVVHLSDPFKVQEKSLLYLSMYLVVFLTGPGKYSLDNNLSQN